MGMVKVADLAGKVSAIPKSLKKSSRPKMDKSEEMTEKELRRLAREIEDDRATLKRDWDELDIKEKKLKEAQSHLEQSKKDFEAQVKKDRALLVKEKEDFEAQKKKPGPENTNK